MLVRRRALQVWSASYVFVRLVSFYVLAAALLSPFLLPHRQIPLSLTESRCPVSLRFSALTPLLRPVRSDARIQAKLAVCIPHEGLTKP